VLVVGESHAAMWMPMFEAVAERADWQLYGGLLDYCPWPHGIHYQYVDTDCLGDQDHLYDVIVDEVDPDIVILGHRPIDDPQNGIRLAGPDGALGLGDGLVALEAAVRRSVDELTDGDRQVVLLEPTPASPSDWDPLSCLSRATFVEECRFVASRRVLDEEALFRSLADSDPDVHSVDLDRAVCPYLPICDPLVDGVVVKWDTTHVTLSFAATVADDFFFNLQLLGVIPVE